MLSVLLPPPTVGCTSDARRYSPGVIYCRVEVDKDLSCQTNRISGIYMACTTTFYVIYYIRFNKLIITPSRTSKMRLNEPTVDERSTHTSPNVANQNPSQQAGKPSTPLVACEPHSSARPRTSRILAPYGLFRRHHSYRSTRALTPCVSLT